MTRGRRVSVRRRFFFFFSSLLFFPLFRSICRAYKRARTLMPVMRAYIFQLAFSFLSKRDVRISRRSLMSRAALPPYDVSSVLSSSAPVTLPPALRRMFARYRGTTGTETRRIVCRNAPTAGVATGLPPFYHLCPTNFDSYLPCASRVKFFFFFFVLFCFFPFLFKNQSISLFLRMDLNRPTGVLNTSFIFLLFVSFFPSFKLRPCRY